jgi:hypothetical protein
MRAMIVASEGQLIVGQAFDRGEVRARQGRPNQGRVGEVRVIEMAAA